MRNKHHDYCINSLCWATISFHNFNRVEPERVYACRQKDIYSQRMLNRKCSIIQFHILKLFFALASAPLPS